MRCLDHMKITEILRLKEMNLFTYRDIAKSVGCSKTTVGEVLSRCKECGLTYSAAVSMTQDEINQLIYPECFGPKQVKEEPDWDAIHARLQSSRKANLQYIWEEEYRPANPDGYSYSRFCAKYVEWKNATGKKVVLLNSNNTKKRNQCLAILCAGIHPVFHIVIVKRLQSFIRRLCKNVAA